jgi:hypothetical protein
MEQQKVEGDEEKKLAGPEPRGCPINPGWMDG